MKGLDYGTVEPVMIASDIYGWSLKVAHGEPLSSLEHDGLQRAHDELAQSLASFPEDARAYYEKLVEIAAAALG